MTGNTDFRNLERELTRTSELTEKAEIIRQLLRTNPTYPKLLSKRTAYREELVTLERQINAQKHGTHEEDIYYLPKYKWRNFLIGPPNSGKSTLLNTLTDSSASVADYPFTTFRPEIGMLRYDGINIQLIELPAIMPGDYYTSKRKYDLMRNGSGLAILVNDTQGIETTLNELQNADITIESPYSLFGTERSRRTKPGFLIYRDMQCPDLGIPAVRIESHDKVRDLLFVSLGVIRVYPYIEYEKAKEPFLLDSINPTVGQFAGKIVEQYTRRFKAAKVWGDSVKFQGQTVGFDHVLRDNDLVNLIER